MYREILYSPSGLLFKKYLLILNAFHLYFSHIFIEDLFISYLHPGSPLMKKIKKLSILFLVVFILSSSISVFAITRPSSLGGYDGNALRAVALSQVGNSGGEKYWKWCGFETRVDWCACFVSWCAGQCCDDTVIYASCPEFEQWFRCRDRLYGTNISPRPGMAVFFDNDGNSRPDHMGILSSYSDGSISVIEGNSSGMCAENTYSSHDKRIISYGAF